MTRATLVGINLDTHDPYGNPLPKRQKYKQVEQRIEQKAQVQKVQTSVIPRGSNPRPRQKPKRRGLYRKMA